MGYWDGSILALPIGKVRKGKVREKFKITHEIANLPIFHFLPHNPYKAPEPVRGGMPAGYIVYPL